MCLIFFIHSMLDLVLVSTFLERPLEIVGRSLSTDGTLPTTHPYPPCSRGNNNNHSLSAEESFSLCEAQTLACQTILWHAELQSTVSVVVCGQMLALHIYIHPYIHACISLDCLSPPTVVGVVVFKLLPLQFGKVTFFECIQLSFIMSMLFSVFTIVITHLLLHQQLKVDQ